MLHSSVGRASAWSVRGLGFLIPSWIFERARSFSFCKGHFYQIVLTRLACVSIHLPITLSCCSLEIAGQLLRLYLPNVLSMAALIISFNITAFCKASPKEKIYRVHSSCNQFSLISFLRIGIV